MTPVIRLYVKVFLRVAIPFVLVMALLQLDRDLNEILMGLLFNTVLAGVVSIILVKIHIWSLRQDGVESLDERTLAVRQSKEIKFQFTLHELLDRLKMDLELGTQKILEYPDRIEIFTAVTWSSWGEKIDLHIHETDIGERVLQISSRPKSGFTILDYGKNRSNVERIATLMTSLRFA
jgi:sulfur carrier protein ThiS